MIPNTRFRGIKELFRARYFVDVDVRFIFNRVAEHLAIWPTFLRHLCVRFDYG